MKLVCAVLASGYGKRFGGGKLLAPFCGSPMILSAFRAAEGAGAERRCVITADETIASLAEEQGFSVIPNPHPERGQSESIRLAAVAAGDADGLLLLAADQPLLTAASVARLAETWRGNPGKIVCLQDENHAGNPAVFPKPLFGELSLLTGDRGAKSLLVSHADSLLKVSCTFPDELSDADTRSRLEELEKTALSRTDSL